MSKATLEYATPLVSTAKCEGYAPLGRCRRAAEFTIPVRGDKKELLLCEHHANLLGYMPPPVKEKE